MSACRSCGADIAWVPLRSGKRMPVEGAEPQEYRVFLRPAGAAPKLTLITEDGDVLTAYLAPTGLLGPTQAEPVTLVRGYESHFATCPHGPGWRRG